MVIGPSVLQRRWVSGASMIEVLVTIVIIAFGLLGMAGLQVRLQASELESYQRSQALLLLNDMVNRMTINRNNVASYLTPATSPVGANLTNCPTTISTVAQSDLGQWCELLKGAGETTDSGTVKVGAMIGGRGCIEASGSDYLVTVAWQGQTPVSAPPSSVGCGQNNYNGTTGSACVSDRCRRVVTTLVRIATL